MKKIHEALQALKSGQVIIVPTDTVYGFIADATNKKAVANIYKIKKRPRSKPLPVFVSGITMARKIAYLDKKQEAILKKYWPGAYTFIVKRRPGKLYGQAKDTIALRMPKNAFLLNLLKKIKKPLVQTSVNISTQEPLKNEEAVIVAFGKSRLVGLMVNSGKAKKRGQAKPSRIYNIISGRRLTTVR